MKFALALYWFEYQDLVIYKCVLYQNSVAITYNKISGPRGGFEIL